MSLVSKTTRTYAQSLNQANPELERQKNLVAEYLVASGSLIPMPAKGIVVARECKKFRLGSGPATNTSWHERVASVYRYLVSVGAVLDGHLTGKTAPPKTPLGRPSGNEQLARDIALRELKRYGYKKITSAGYLFLARTLNRELGNVVKEGITEANARRVLVRLAKMIAGEDKFSVEKQDFYDSPEWIRLRYVALQKYGRKCMCCGKTAEQGAVLHVDHVKPRSKYPDLELDINNLQILCSDCNIGKGAWDESDFRVKGKGPKGPGSN